MILSRSHKKLLIPSLIIFMFIYEFSIINTPSILSSRKLSILIVTIYLLLKNDFKDYSNRFKFKIYYKRPYILISLILVYILGYLLFLKSIYMSVEESQYILARMLYFILYFILGTQLFTKYFKSINDFLKSLIIANIIQSSVVYGQFLFIGFRNFLYKTFESTGNISYLRTDRANGLGAEGANLSILLFCGLFACGYFIIKNKKINSKLIISYMYILFATMLVGRTGFVLGVINILIIIIFMSRWDFNRITITCIKIAIVSFFVLVIFNTVIENYVEIERFEKILTWSQSIFKSGFNDRSFVHLSNMDIPKISMETIIGTGIYRGTSTMGTVIQHDGGYIQSYFSMGLFNSLIFYCGLYIFFLKMISKVYDNNIRKYFFILFIILGIMEFKEPFTIKGMIPFILTTSCILTSKNSNYDV